MHCPQGASDQLAICDRRTTVPDARGASTRESRLAVSDTGSEPLLDEEELADEFRWGLEETDLFERAQVGEETSDPERAAAMLAEAEQDPEVTT